jgi:hypothetical protein
MNRRSGGPDLAELIVYNSGRKGIRDADLAQACGFTVEQMYGRLGHKLLMIARSSWFELQPAKYSGAQGEPRPVIVFTLSGVIMISAWLGTERALEVAIAILPSLRLRQRSSKNKRRRPRRVQHPSRQARYQRALARLQEVASKVPRR